MEAGSFIQAKLEKKDALKSLLGELIKCFPHQAFQFLPALELLCKTGFDHLLLQTDVWG